MSKVNNIIETELLSKKKGAVGSLLWLPVRKPYGTWLQQTIG